MQRLSGAFLEEGEVRSQTQQNDGGFWVDRHRLSNSDHVTWGYMSGGSEGRARGSDTVTSNGEISMEESEQLLEEMDSSEHSYQQREVKRVSA